MTLDDSSMAQTSGRNTRPQGGGQALLVAVAWAVVGIPALWGISRTLITSANLFTTPSPQHNVSSNGAPAAK